MNSEKHSPPKEIAEERLHATSEQKELSAPGEIFFESEHKLLEMPADLKFGEYFSYGRGNYTIISGTFDGRFLELEESESFGIRGNADGNSISEDEARSLWEKIYPFAKKIHEDQSAETKALEEKRADEFAREMAVEEEKKRKEEEKKRSGVKELLNKKLEGIELSEDDRKFTEKIVDEIAELSVMCDRDSFPESKNAAGSVNNALRIRKWDHEGNPTPKSEYDEYERKRELLYRLLGANAQKPHIWEAGFGNTYIHSRIYDTVLPDIVVREEYETEYQRVGSGSQIHIERNSRFARKH